MRPGVSRDPASLPGLPVGGPGLRDLRQPVPRALPEVLSLPLPRASLRTHDNARRARELAAQVAGPLPRSVYVDVLASGPCAYCGAAATAVDHVRPLAEGGHEARYNLAPACRSCNCSKGGKLLIHWDPVRVAHGAAHSPAVAAELDRETMAMY